MEQTSENKKITLSLAPANPDPKLNTAFEAQSVSLTELGSILTTHNYSNIIWRSDHRLEDNFDRAESIIIDIDSGMTIEAARSLLRKARINYALLTTKSHTETQHRFRLVVFINRPILSIEDYKRIIPEIRVNRFPAWDPNTLDGARFYFASPQEAFFELWLDGKDYEVDRDPITLNMREFVEKAFPNNLLVKTTEGSAVSVSELKEHTIIFCPFHEDSNPSAFLDISSSAKNTFIHCSSCNKTYWMRRESIPVEEALDSFWSVGKSIFQFVIQENEFISSELGKDKLFIMTDAFDKADKDRIFASLVETKHMPALRRVNYLGDPSVVHTTLTVSPESGCVDVSVSPAAVPYQRQCLRRPISGWPIWHRSCSNQRLVGRLCSQQLLQVTDPDRNRETRLWQEHFRRDGHGDVSVTISVLAGLPCKLH